MWSLGLFFFPMVVPRSTVPRWGPAVPRWICYHPLRLTQGVGTWKEGPARRSFHSDHSNLFFNMSFLLLSVRQVDETVKRKELVLGVIPA